MLWCPLENWQTRIVGSDGNNGLVYFLRPAPTQAGAGGTWYSARTMDGYTQGRACKEKPRPFDRGQTDEYNDNTKEAEARPM